MTDGYIRRVSMEPSMDDAMGLSVNDTHIMASSMGGVRGAVHGRHYGWVRP